eukprot:1160314-Pelagomonas_calceolata.AAC.3
MSRPQAATLVLHHRTLQELINLSMQMFLEYPIYLKAKVSSGACTATHEPSKRARSIVGLKQPAGRCNT